MSTSYEIVGPSFRQSLRVLARLLDRAEAHFAAKGRDPEALMDLRLAPDMNPFPSQFESAVNNAVGSVARLRGLPVRRVEGLASLADLRKALEEALAELSDLDPGVFAEADTREIVLPSPKGDRHFGGLDYVLRLALPNVHFHTAIAYAILRAEGVEIGKRDFLGDLPPRRPAATTATG